MRRILTRGFCLICATVSLYAMPLHAQRATDRARVAVAFAEAIINDTSSIQHDHGGPFWLIRSRHRAAWKDTVATRFRRADVGQMPQDSAHALKLLLISLHIRGDSATVTVSWSRCSPQPVMLNAWSHTTVYRFVRVRTQWQARSDEVTEIFDGHCGSSPG